MAKAKIRLGDGADEVEVAATEVGFRVINDGAAEIELDDGAVLRLKPIVVAVLKTDQRNQDGERVYVVQNIVRVLVRKPGQGDEQ